MFVELLEAFDVWLACDAPFLFGFRAGSTMFHSAPVELAALATEEVAGRLDARRSAKRAASILDFRWPRATKSSEAQRDESAESDFFSRVPSEFLELAVSDSL